jgi:hypothetical protein
MGVTLLAIAGAVLLAGCAPRATTFPRIGPVLPEGATIAFLPFVNLTEHEGANRFFEAPLLVELGRWTDFRVQDPGIVTGSLRTLRILTPDRMSAEQMTALSAATNATYFLAGVVTTYQEATSERDTPQAAASLRLVDPATGSVIWAASLARRGDDAETLFGLGRVRSLDQLVSVMARDLAKAMAEATREPLKPRRHRRE